MNILILGGNGYLGSKVVHYLKKQGSNIFCTRRKTSNLSRVADMKDKISWIPASLEEIDVALTTLNFDWVLNTACKYGRDNNVEEIIEANLEFPLKVLAKVAKNGTKNYITIGTGLPSNLNMYSFSKKIFNDFGKFYVDKFNLNFVCLSLEMLYGSDEPLDRFLPSTIRKMLEGKEVLTTIGTQRRDIISVNDIIKAIGIVLDAKLEGYWDIPIGTGVAPTISEIIDFIWEKTGKKSVVNKGAISTRDNEPDCVADTTILQSLGIWKPKFWQDGLAEMIESIRSTPPQDCMKTRLTY